jgi:hypothetical protein
MAFLEAPVFTGRRKGGAPLWVEEIEASSRDFFFKPLLNGLIVYKNSSLMEKQKEQEGL